MVFMPFSSQFQSRAFQGGQPNIISQKMTPSDQISHFVVYCTLQRICGAMQMGLPTQDLSICEPKLSTYLANPKSPILYMPSLMSMLAGLRSRCMIFSRMSQLKPLRSCLIIQNTYSSLNFLRFISYFRSPFLQNSVMMQRLFLELSTSLNFTMLGWLNRFSRQIYEKIAFYRYLSLVNVARSIFLIATFSLLSRSMPSQTLPQTPSPRHFEV